MPFRTLEIYASGDGGYYETRLLDEVLEKAEGQGGYHAFYIDPSPLDRRQTTSGSLLRDRLLKVVRDESNILDVCSLDENDLPQAGKLYLLGNQLPENYAQKISHFLRRIRETSANAGSPFKHAAAYALHQASVYDLVGDRHAQSVDIADTLGYHEYFLWSDGDLWTQEDWKKQVDTLAQDTAFENSEQGRIDADRRIAWLGSGAVSLQLKHLCNSSKEVWPYPPALAQILDAAIKRLERYDHAVVAHYIEKESREPPGYVSSDYVRLLCNFLPDHRSRLNSDKFLSSNSLGDFGGPRPWSGVLDWRLQMMLIHLLLDGLLTLWPKTPETEDSQGTELVLQPAGLAILYWAARTADMPWTRTPDEFLNNYQWDDSQEVCWFGGRRRHWLGSEWRVST